MRKLLHNLSSSQMVVVGFLIVISIGTGLLCLPISSKTGNWVPFSTALFTATTATCVTGLVVVPTVSWSVFGQAVILALIQIGGLGVITIMFGLFIIFRRKIGLGNRLLLQDALNLNTMSGIVKFTKKVLVGTFVVEAIGAGFYMLEFVPRFGLKGIWISIFNAVSAFCNAGMDIIGENSFYDYTSNLLINIVTMVLIVLGGLGYIVWWDVLRVLKLKLKSKAKAWQNLTLHSKIAIMSTLSLILGGAVLIFVFEYNNTKTIADFNVGNKMLASVFQSVTTRTAGFASLPQENFTKSSALLSMILMFIGGSPVGTAGGIKTATFAVLLLSTISVVKGKNDVSVFNRRISKTIVNKCSAIAFISLVIILVSTTLLSLTTNRAFIDTLYEVVSATDTVGLSRNFTPFLNETGKYIIIFTMFFGRIGPIAMALSLNTKKQNENIIRNPKEDISVG